MDVRDDGFIRYAGRWRSPESVEKDRERERLRSRGNPAAVAVRMQRARAMRPDHYSAAMARFRATPKGRAALMFANALARSRNSGVPFAVTKAWIAERIESGFCEATGLPFDLAPSETTFNPWAPSLDQREPGKGYTLENTQVVCNIHNACKNEWDEVAHRLYVEACARRYGMI